MTKARAVSAARRRAPRVVAGLSLSLVGACAFPPPQADRPGAPAATADGARRDSLRAEDSVVFNRWLARGGGAPLGLTGRPTTMQAAPDSLASAPTAPGDTVETLLRIDVPRSPLDEAPAVPEAVRPPSATLPAAWGTVVAMAPDPRGGEQVWLTLQAADGAIRVVRLAPATVWLRRGTAARHTMRALRYHWVVRSGHDTGAAPVPPRGSSFP